VIKTHTFNTLNTSDPIIDAVYEGGSQGNMADEPIHKILPGISNQSGFRVKKLDKRGLCLSYTHDSAIHVGQMRLIAHWVHFNYKC